MILGEAGAVVDIVTGADAGDDIEIFNGLLSPGFINCHCHLELSHMRGLIPRHTGLVDFVFKVVNERHFEEPEILEAIRQAENEMIENGIIAVGDICNTNLTIQQKTQRNLYYHNFIEASGFPPSAASIRFQRALDLYDAFSAVLPANSIVPHAPYSVSPELFSMINDFGGNRILTIHNQETAAENELFRAGNGDFLRMYKMMGIDISFFKAPGKSSVQTYQPWLTKAKSLIFVHNVETNEEDIRFITLNPQPSTLCFFCLCPNANLYISNKLPDVDQLIQHGCNIVLGTDSLASNNRLSIAAEIQTLLHHFPAIENKTVLQWATINGAKALDVDDRYGSFQKGKRPGVVLLNENFSEVKKIV